MDQLRKILAWLKEYHFWVLSGLVVLIGMGISYKASGSLSAVFDKNQKEIKSGFESLTKVKSEPFHPNDVIKQKQIKETEEQKKSVAAIWQQLYDRQKSKVLEWPSGPGELSQQFVDYVKDKDFGADIPSNLREHYQNYIFHHFSELPKQINARELREGDASSPGMGFSRSWGAEGGSTAAGGQLQDDHDYTCEWEATDQAAVRAELEFPQTPTNLRIWVTQENLWVYHTLLDAIKNTNDAAGAKRISNAAIRRVYSLEVGRRAGWHSRSRPRIYHVPMAAPTSAEGPGIGPSGGTPAPTAPPMDYGTGPGAVAQIPPEQESQYLLGGRYLDDQEKPMGGVSGGGSGPEGSGGESAAAGPPVDLASLTKAEFKRLPVRMVLQIDLRHLPRLIAECANKELQIEVKEVRINPTTDVSLGMGGAEGGFSRMGEMGAGGGNPFGQRSGPQMFDSHPQIANVVIQGVIYIFNNPKNSTVLQAEPAQLAAQ